MLARLNIRWNTKYHNKAWFSADWAPLLIASFLWPLTLALSLVVIPCVLIALTVHKVGSTFPVKRLLFGKHFKEVV